MELLEHRGSHPPSEVMNPPKQLTVLPGSHQQNGVHLCGLKVRNLLKKLQHALLLVSKRLSIFHTLVKGTSLSVNCLSFYKAPISDPEHPAQGPWHRSNAHLLNEQDPKGQLRGWTSRPLAEADSPSPPCAHQNHTQCGRVGAVWASGLALSQPSSSPASPLCPVGPG